MASIDWSYDLLAPHEQSVLRRLAVFGGDFTAEAATAVAGETTDGEDLDESPAAQEHDVLVVTRRLVDKSLVVTRRHGDQVRYRLLDTVRHYALDKLRRCDEVAATRDRHLRHYLDLALEAEAGFAHDQDHSRVRLEAERDNIQDALRWALTPARAETGRLFAATMSHQWLIRSQAQEGLGFLRLALDLDPSDRSSVQARLHLGQAMLAMVSGHVHQAGDSAAMSRRDRHRDR